MYDRDNDFRQHQPDRSDGDIPRAPENGGQGDGVTRPGEADIPGAGFTSPAGADSDYIEAERAGASANRQRGESGDSYKFKSADLTDSVYRQSSESSEAIREGRTEPPGDFDAPRYAAGQYAQSEPVHDGNGNNMGTAGKGKRKKAGSRGNGRFLALAMVCCLIVSILGGYVGSIIRSESSGSDNGTVNMIKAPTSDSSGTAATETAAVTGEKLTASQIYELATQQVVSVTAQGVSTYYGQSSTTTSMGTGFVISEDGYILTNYHVVSSALGTGALTISFKDGKSFEAKFVGGYEAGDVALLKIEATGLSPVTLGDSNDITVGEDVYVVGNALGEYDYTMTAGLVSGLDRELVYSDSSGDSINMFQLDAAVNAGNSGGPVYNSYGYVIGIVTSKISSSSSSTAASVEGLGFAIPINDAVSIVEDIQTKGYVEGNVLIGVSPSTVDSTVTESYGIPSGVYVGAVTQGGAAEKAGIQVKDIITKLGDTDITSVSDLKKALRGYSVGDKAIVTIYRSGETLEVEVTFTEVQTTEAASSSSDSDEGNQLPGSSGGFGN